MKQLILAFFLLIAFKSSLKATNTDTLNVNPNPCDSLLTIHFSLAQSDTISLDIYDITGQVVKNFFTNTLLPSGSYSINYISYYLANGVYFLKLKITTTSKTIKIIKDKNYVGINEQTLSNLKINIFPNPTTNFLVIDYKGIKKIQLFDYKGSLVYQNLTEQTNIYLKDILEGIYLLKVYSDKNELLLNKKIIKY